VPPRIDEALDELWDKYEVTTPVVDFLLSNPFEELIAEVKDGIYAGIHEVDGVACHHLSFVQDNINWQIWIEDGRRVVPRKFVVTYKNDPGSPQTVTIFKDWDFSTKHQDQLFEFKPAEGAVEIEFLPLAEM
jgi:hypothetical protein